MVTQPPRGDGFKTEEGRLIRMSEEGLKALRSWREPDDNCGGTEPFLYGKGWGYRIRYPFPHPVSPSGEHVAAVFSADLASLFHVGERVTNRLLATLITFEAELLKYVSTPQSIRCFLEK